YNKLTEGREPYCIRIQHGKKLLFGLQSMKKRQNIVVEVFFHLYDRLNFIGVFIYIIPNITGISEFAYSCSCHTFGLCGIIRNWFAVVIIVREPKLWQEYTCIYCEVNVILSVMSAFLEGYHLPYSLKRQIIIISSFLETKWF